MKRRPRRKRRYSRRAERDHVEACRAWWLKRVLPFPPEFRRFFPVEPRLNAPTFKPWRTGESDRAWAAIKKATDELQS